MSLQTVLQEYWLTSKQSDVFLVCLELGSAPASTIARKAGLKRVSTYNMLKDLQKQWLVSFFKKNNVNYYSASSPTLLVEKAQQKYESLKSSLPELLAIANIFDNRPKVEYFEWREAVEQQYYDLLSVPWDTIYSFFNMNASQVQFRDRLLRDFVAKRVSLWISAKVIMKWDADDKQYLDLSDNKKNLTDVILVDDWIFDISCHIDMYAWNKVSFWETSWEWNMYCLTVTSTKIHTTMKNIFQSFWNISKQNK